MDSFPDKRAWNKKLLYLIYFGAIAILILSVITSPNRNIYDEQFFFPNIAYLHNVGLSKFITTYMHQAPGPLYEFVHYFTYSLFDSVVSVRIDNLIFALLNILLIALILRRKGEQDYLLISLVYITIPLAWAHSGIAITETPTIFFALLFFYFFDKNIDKPHVSITDTIILSLLITCAIIGRSTFLTLPLALFLFFILKFKERRYSLLFTGVFSLIIPIYIFYLWKGLVPPEQSYLSRGGFSLYHLMLMPSYSGIILFIMYPNSIRIIPNNYKAFLILFTLSLITFVLLKNSDVLIPMQTFKFSHAEYLKYIVTVVYSATCSFFITAACTTFFEEKNDVFLLIFLFVVLISCTTIRITDHFSAGYAFQIMPFLILIFRKYFRKNLLQLAVGLIGIILGILSLRGYYMHVY